MFDRVQPTVTSGNSYVVPSLPPATSLVLTSWSHIAGTGTGQLLSMKVFRRTGLNTFQVVGKDGPRALTGGVLNTFSGLDMPVQPGDYVGNSTPANAGAPSCIFSTANDQILGRMGDLAVGDSGDFLVADFPYHLNTSAVVEPDNRFTLSEAVRNKKKGTAILSVDVPNPGELTGSGKGVKVASAAVISKPVTAGATQLLIKAKGKKENKLKRKGKVKVNPTITYTPTGGAPSSQSIEVKLKKKLKKP